MIKFGSTISRNGLGAAPAALMLGTLTFSALGLGALSPSASAANGAPIIPGGASSSTATSTVTSTANTDAGTDADADSSASIPSGAVSDTTITSTATATETAQPKAGADDVATGTAIATDTTPTPYADAGDTAADTTGDAATETAQPEDLAVTGSSTQNLAIALAVMGLIAAGGYGFALRRNAA